MKRFIKKIYNYYRTTSPQDDTRACLCEDNTYRIECCDGSLQAQGIGLINKSS